MADGQTFIDEATITVTSGDGGDGSAHFRREKYVPHGGPDGGDGGRGGDVIFVADDQRGTLGEFRHRRKLAAERGAHGQGQRKDGKNGRTLELLVPLGTLIFDALEADPEAEPLADLSEPGARFVAAKGGRGGWGNTHFATPTRQAPDFAIPGKPGETRELRLSLKLLADVGLLGFPNAGKSTLLSRISAARPKVAAYPFTTLVPALGVVEFDLDNRFVVADVPGLIEGASGGAGLGDRFLRHVERTRVLVHLLDVAAMLMEERDLLEGYDVIRGELANYQPALLERREIAVLNKVELLTEPEDAARVDAIEATLRERGLGVHRISAATGEGVTELVAAMWNALQEIDREAELARREAERAAAATSAAGNYRPEPARPRNDRDEVTR